MTRYWVSWYSGNYADEGCTAPPFTYFTSGYRDRNDDSERDDCTICALIEAEDTKDIWELVEKHFPDYQERFCDECEADWIPNNRFPGATAYTITPIKDDAKVE